MRFGRRRLGVSVRTFLPVAAIAGDALRLSDGGLRAVLECPTLAFGIKGEAEQRAVIDGWTALLNSLSYPLEILIRSRRLDPSRLEEPPESSDPAQVALRDSYRRLLDELAGTRRILDRRFYVVVPQDGSPKDGRGSAAHPGLDALEQRVRWVEGSLRRLDLQPRRLGGRELAELLRSTLDPVAALQPVADHDDFTDLASLLAPAAISEVPRFVSASGLLARTLAVVRYSSHLQPGWLGDLHALDGDLDVALHLRPNPGQVTMAFLERRIAELSSTVRASEQRGRRGDPYRRVALQDALELQDGIAQGSERLFDCGLYLTVWAEHEPELDSATRRVEALLGARVIHTRRLLFQMRAGLITSLPLGLEAAPVRRVLSTSALAATFPFTGTDLPASSGLLYGVNSQTKSPVVLDRFALENHNAVVFATSGAGKSYLVKVELARALLAGQRALVIDPEGEYAPLLRRLGAAIVAVRPSAGVALDPFALPDTSPGTLFARIAHLTTLIELLVGDLSPTERAAVEAALSASYAEAGFRDGAPSDGLLPPRLADIQRRLRQSCDMDAVAMRLERYISGSGSWLFQGGGVRTSDEGSSAFVLAGLPEEERAAAMFCVLDRIWRDLAHTKAPTLVVVDEAWWLMRRADTAAFLHRMVKTARKRHAGLTLVTQDVQDVLASPDGEALIQNSALQILMKQAPQALPRIAELFRLTRAEQSWLLGAERGEGLLIAQGRRVPFQVIASEEEARLIAQREHAG
jgi:hypothetical protein